MDNGTRDLLAFCTSLDFGAVDLSREEEQFRTDLNYAMLTLCDSLPKSTQTEASLFLIEYFQTPLSGGFNFINYFYAPAWSILFWILDACQGRRKLHSKYVKDAKIGHTMAMFLHAFDDHLADAQLPVTHLALLMRSQSWMNMIHACQKLAKGVDNGSAVVGNLLDDYYSSIGKSDTKTLDSYCSLFRKQMATWLIVPTLLAKRIDGDEEYSFSIQSAYCSFGLAWRLLDDLQDMEKDMRRGVHSSVYVCLDDKSKRWWDKDFGSKKESDDEYVQRVLSYLKESAVICTIRERARSELESASSIADACGLPGLARELRCLMKPL